jgi:elongation of very long chain fatty acids protein 6
MILDFFASLRTIEGFYAMNQYTYSIPTVAILVYFATLVILPRVLPVHGINIKPILLVWNLFFSLFSLAMLIGSMVEFVPILIRDGFQTTFCDIEQKLFLPSDMIMWGSLFIISKYFELFDTVFIVIIFTWFGWYYKFTPAFFCMPMNAAIHVVMYFYYFLRELGFSPSWNKFLTFAQTLQMFIGLAVNIVWAIYVYATDIPCDCQNNQVMMWMSVIIYASYLYLFAQFYGKKYTPKPSIAPAAKTK